MKKSECFRMAQLAVLEYGWLSNEDKLEVIRELQDKESTALYSEKKKAEETLKEACQAAHKLSEATTAHNTATAERGDTENAEIESRDCKFPR